MSTKPKKYIFVNGVMKLNPEYQETKTITSEHHLKSLSSSSSKQNQNSSNVAPLAIISNFNDIEEAKESDGSSEIQLPLSTTNAINFMMSETYSNQYSVAQENNLFDGLCNYFTMYEVPIGLISRLLEIRNYRLNFMIDDSGSMGSQTDVTYGEATDHVRHGHQGNAFMTRWEEAENRLHIIIDILAYIPAKDIQISFMNNRDVKISLTHYGKTPEQFQLEYHSSISEIFHRLRLGGTPTLQTLRNGFEEASHHEEPTLHYLFTDGVPSDSTVDNLKSFIKNRAHPEKNPLTLISCTNEDSECEWMKEIEEVAPFTSEVDDYHDEKEEVLHDQGPAFPFTKGFWLLCNLISVISPDDLDALDENVPLSKFTLDELFGRVHNEREYEYYWSHNPHSKRYQNKYHQFLTEPAPSRRFIPKEERSQRKKDRCVIM